MSGGRVVGRTRDKESVRTSVTNNQKQMEIDGNGSGYKDEGGSISAAPGTQLIDNPACSSTGGDAAPHPLATGRCGRRAAGGRSLMRQPCRPRAARRPAALPSCRPAALPPTLPPALPPAAALPASYRAARCPLPAALPPAALLPALLPARLPRATSHRREHEMP